MATAQELQAGGSLVAVRGRVDRSSDKHFYADAEVNGQPIRFLVDTGAGEIALTEEDARKAGMNVDPKSTS